MRAGARDRNENRALTLHANHIVPPVPLNSIEICLCCASRCDQQRAHVHVKKHTTRFPPSRRTHLPQKRARALIKQRHCDKTRRRRRGGRRIDINKFNMVRSLRKKKKITTIVLSYFECRTELCARAI